MSELVLRDQAPLAELEEAEGEEAKRQIVHSLSERTLQVYSKAWDQWVMWCQSRGYSAFPASVEDLKRYLAYLYKDRNYRLSSIRVALAAIRRAHARADYDPTAHPDIQDQMTGIAKLAAKERDPIPKVAALSLGKLRAMLKAEDTNPNETVKLRNCALLLFGVFTGLRADNISQLRIRDLEHVPGLGYEITIRRSKTDQHGRGRIIALGEAQDVDLCPVMALQRWLAARGTYTPDSAVFPRIRSGGHVDNGTGDGLTRAAISHIYKQMARRAGLPNWQDFASRTGRSSLATLSYAAIEQGRTTEKRLMEAGGWKSLVVRQYDRSSLWSGSSLTKAITEVEVAS